MEKEKLLKKILEEYKIAYNEIVAGELTSIPIKNKVKRTFFVQKTRNWGLASDKVRSDGRMGDTTTPYRLEKLASYNLFTETDFNNYNGEKTLHDLIGYNDSDAKYIMIYLYDRVMKHNNKNNEEQETATKDDTDFGYESIIVGEEGAKRVIEVNRYERSRKLREECIKAYGNRCQCSICGFDFEKVYGEHGRGFIHIHHLQPLHELGTSHKVTANELIPVCPNCHAMLHRGETLLTPEKLRKIIDNNKYR